MCRLQRHAEPSKGACNAVAYSAKDRAIRTGTVSSVRNCKIGATTTGLNERQAQATNGAGGKPMAHNKQ